MKFQCIIIFTLAVGLHSASAIDPEKLASNPARIVAESMSEIPLKTGDSNKSWGAIPKQFTFYGAAIFTPERDQLGVAEFRVIEDGYLLLACHFDYQGNSGGDWRKDALSEEDFREQGWKKIREAKIGGPLLQVDNRKQTIFFKKVRVGEHYKLRCNKYDPPYPILLQRTDLLNAD